MKSLRRRVSKIKEGKQPSYSEAPVGHVVHGRCPGFSSYDGARVGTEVGWGPDWYEHWARVEDYHSEGSQQQLQAYMESHLRLINCASSKQRLCPFYRLGALTLSLSPGSSLCVSFATLGTLMSFLAPEPSFATKEGPSLLLNVTLLTWVATS